MIFFMMASKSPWLRSPSTLGSLIDFSMSFGGRRTYSGSVLSQNKDRFTSQARTTKETQPVGRSHQKFQERKESSFAILTISKELKRRRSTKRRRKASCHL